MFKLPVIQQIEKEILLLPVALDCFVFFLGAGSLCTLYYSLVYQYLYYCACVWDLTCHSNIKRLVTLQKRAVRTICKSAFDAHTDPIFKSLKLLKFENIVSLQVAKIKYLYENGQLPESFNNMF